MSQYCNDRNFLDRTMNICVTDVSSVFFSKDNLNLIQHMLYDNVKSKYGYKIDKQSDDDLSIIMRGIFNLYNNNQIDLKQNIINLNDIVIEKCTGMVISNINMQKQYLHDASTLPTPAPRPVVVSNKDSFQNTYFI